MKLSKLRLAATIVSLCLSVSLAWGQREPATSGETAGAVPVPAPPMGWSSWNSFSNRINSKITMEQAKAMVDTGMAKLGYRYINIDEGWWLGTRDEDGNITVDPKQWPAIAPGERAGDMSNIVRYIHSLGLKAGIYTDAGEAGCSFYGPDLGPPMPHTGSEGHYEQDFLQFARWGFDYVKVDWCGGNGENLDPALQYAEVARAIRKAEVATGHILYYSICNWGKNSPWTWAPGVGGVPADIWRTSGDIVAPIVADSPNANRKASFTGMLGNFDQGIHPEAQHTGFYNDPDMMVLGMPGLTDAQNQVHMTLWAISGAPLIVGADLGRISPANLALLTNPEVLGIDQDPAGLQAVRIPEESSKVEIWAKKLAATSSANGRRAVVLLNRTGAEAPVTVRWSTLGLNEGPARLRDLWLRKDMGEFRGSYETKVPAQSALMLLVEGREASSVPYEAVSSAAPLASENCKETEWAFSHVTAPSTYAWVTVFYSNPGKSAAVMELRVNGEHQSAVALPAKPSSSGAITIVSKLRTDRENELIFASRGSANAAIRSISVTPNGARRTW